MRRGCASPHFSPNLGLRLAIGPFNEIVLPFDEILEAVESGQVDAGLIIHEGQLLYERLGLHALFEPALTWAREEELPLPLGAVAVRRDLPQELQDRLADCFAHVLGDLDTGQFLELRPVPQTLLGQLHQFG